MTATCITVEELLRQKKESLIIDLRGAHDFEPAIPCSRSIYLLDLFDCVKDFENKNDALLSQQPILLYCRNEGGSKMLQSKFSRRYKVKYLEGGMIAYLETITRILAEHPYKNPSTREEMIRKLLAALTNRTTPFKTFSKVAENLMRHR